MSTSIIQVKNRGGLLGYNIRAEMIFRMLAKSGYSMWNLGLPLVCKKNLSNLTSLKHLLFDVFPPHKVKGPRLSFIDSIMRQIDYDVTLNGLIRICRRIKPTFSKDTILLAEDSRAAWLTSMAAKQLSIPCIFDAHGLLFAESMKNRNWQHTLSLERYAFENSDYLIVVSEVLKEYIHSKFGLPESKIIVAPNGSDLKDQHAKYEKPLKVIYAGILAYWEKIDDFLDIAKLADPELFKFFLAGIGPMQHHVIRRIQKERVPVTYLGHISKKEIPKLFAQMQIGIAPSTRDLARKVASPIKVFDYLASGLPVITPKIGDWGQMVADEQCGIALEHDDICDYIWALDMLASEDNWNRLSRNAVMMIRDKHSWDTALQPILELIEGLGRSWTSPLFVS